MVKKSVVDIKKNIYTVQILEEIYKNGQVTIATLAKELHTSVPSITLIINELVESKWLFEVGFSKTKSGRRPILYDLNSQKRKVLVFNINLYSTQFFVIDLRNNILHEEIIDVSIQDALMIEKISKKALEITSKFDIWSVGISSPGLIISETGINITYSNHNLDGKSINTHIETILKIPTFLSHDTQSALIGEHHFGLAKNKKNVLLINLDWGIGMAILSNGNIVKGARGFAGELGHIQVNPNGELCHCGKRGCLETMASAQTLYKRASEGLKGGFISSLSLKKTGLRLEDIIEAALNGDEFCIDLILDISKELGKGLSIAIHMFNPEIVIIDGLLSKAGELMLSSLIQSINKYCIPDFKKDLQVLISSMDEKAKVLGIKSLAFSHMLEKGIL
jgi:predicted NBD/HSP70 family sugar kinase